MALAIVSLVVAPTLVASSNISNSGPAHVVAAQAAPAVLPVANDRDDQAASRSYPRGRCPDGNDCPPPPAPPAHPPTVSVQVQVTHPPQPTPSKTTKGKTSSGGSSGGSTVNVPSSCSGYHGNQAIGCALLGSFGFGLDQMPCLVKLWNRESGWRVSAENPSSHAFGIPQALPGYKMKSAGSDWQTNPATQIRWGLGYIGGRYGTPCGARGPRPHALVLSRKRLAVSGESFTCRFCAT
jgi:hypothetical protein